MDYQRTHNTQDTFHWVVLMNVYNTPVDMFNPYEVCMKFCLESKYDFVSKHDIKYIFADVARFLAHERRTEFKKINNLPHYANFPNTYKCIPNIVSLIKDGNILDRILRKYRLRTDEECMDFLDMCLKYESDDFSYKSLSYNNIHRTDSDWRCQVLTKYDRMVFDALKIVVDKDNQTMV